MPLTAIIFDMDGLMVNTEPLARQAWDLALEPYEVVLADEIHGRIIGRRTDQSAQIIIDAYQLPLTAAALSRHKTGIFTRLRDEQGVPPMPGLTELHTAVADRRLPWAVATSSPRRHAEAVLTRLNLRQQCRAIAAGDEVAHGKPAPDIYLLAAERLSVPPQQCLALEDSAPGCRAAVAAGMVGVAVPTDDTRHNDFSFAHYTFSSLHDVAHNLDTLLRSRP